DPLVAAGVDVADHPARQVVVVGVRRADRPGEASGVGVGYGRALHLFQATQGGVAVVGGGAAGVHLLPQLAERIVVPEAAQVGVIHHVAGRVVTALAELIDRDGL